MCSVIGYSGKFNKELVSKLLYNSRIRGLHAFGYAYVVDNNKVAVHKFTDYDEFYNHLLDTAPSTFIAHFRYSTSGDFTNPENNQPIVKDTQQGTTAIVFNGVISQKSKEAMEQEFGVVIPAENDGYILIEKYNDEDFNKRNDVSYACVGISNGELFFTRNEYRPLYLSLSEHDDYVIIGASTNDILKRSGIDNGFLMESTAIWSRKVL